MRTNKRPPPTRDPTGQRTHTGELSAVEQERRHQAWLDDQPAVARCAVDGCPFVHDGTLASGRDAYAEHRELEHPGLLEDVRARRRREAEARRVQALADRELERVVSRQSTRREKRVSKITTYRCDSCGKVLEPQDAEKKAVLTIATPSTRFTADVCAECTGQIAGGRPIGVTFEEKKPWGGKKPKAKAA